MNELVNDFGVRHPGGGQADAADLSSHDRLWPSRGFPGEADEPAPFDLRLLIDAVTADLSGRHRARELALVVRYSIGAPRYLVGPGDRIRQVMTKLVGRAAELAMLLRESAGRASAGRGQVVVDVQGDLCSDRCAAMRLRVEVAGPGISGGGDDAPPVAASRTALRVDVPPACLRQDEAEPGLVSTLADCRHLVELMGGRLGALTDPGTGSFVWLAMKLPVDTSRPTSGGWFL